MFELNPSENIIVTKLAERLAVFQKPYLTPREAGIFLSTSYSWINKNLKNMLPLYTLKGKLYFKREDIVVLLESKKIDGDIKKFMGVRNEK